MSQDHPSGARRSPSSATAGLACAVVLVAAPGADGASPPRAPTVPGAARVATPRATTSGAVQAVRLVAETRGTGRSRRVVTRIDVFSPDGTRTRARTVPGGGSLQQPALSPDGRRVAFAQPDGRIAVVALRGGPLRRLRPRGLPAPRPAGRDYDPARRSVVEGAPVSWSPDGRVVVAHGLVRRSPPQWATSLDDARSVACVVRTGRCTSAGSGAPADLLPLAGGRTLRLDGPTVADDDEGTTNLGLDSRRRERQILATRRTAVRTTLSLTRSPLGTGRRTVLRTSVGTGRSGIVGLGSPVAGPTGVLLRGTSVAFSRREDGSGTSDEGPGVEVRTRALPTRIVTPGGRLRTLPRRLGVTPIGSLADGRWLVPTAEVGPSGDLDRPEPGLATLDRRGRVRAVAVGGRVLTPVRLALNAGLPDDFAAGAQFVAARSVDGALLIQLANTGSGGTVFFPADVALLRVPLDGSSPARIVDRQGGASYDVR